MKRSDMYARPKVCSYKECPQRESHNGEGPSGYLAWHEWADETMKVYVQRRCPGCGFLVMLESRDNAASRALSETGEQT